MILYRILIVAFLFLTIGRGFAADAPAANLEELRQKIDALKQELQVNEATRDEAADALKDSEQAISEANHTFAELSRQQLQSQADLDKTEADIARTRQQIDINRDHIIKLLRARYRNGEHEALRLLLNRQDPARLSRDLLYYRYIANAQQKLTLELQTEFEKLTSLSDALRLKNDELLRIVAEKKAQRDKLRREQAQRQQVLSKLSNQIGEQRKEIGKLQRDEKRLTQLVEKLDRIIREREAKEARAQQKRAHTEKQANAHPGKTPAETHTPEPKPEIIAKENNELPDNSIDGKKFADLKGELHLPTRGEVIGKFGASRSEGTTWKGVFIRAPGSQPVHAVASGHVVFADWLRGFGNMIIIDHGNGFMSLYGTAESLMKTVGDSVIAGQEIATCGNSGGNVETGIYFELRHMGKPIDPLAWAK